jgi:hypothetical protein
MKSTRENQEYTAHPVYFEKAQELGVEIKENSSKSKLFNDLWYQLQQDEDDEKLALWFSWRVYRYLLRKNDMIVIDESIYSEELKEIASLAMSDEKVMRSIKKYDGHQLRRFGKWTSKTNGFEIRGGSTGTTAYKEVRKWLLKYRYMEEGNVSPASPVKPKDPHTAGCLGVVLAFSFLGYAGNQFFF